MEQDILRTNIAQLEKGIRILTEAQASLKELLVDEGPDDIMDMQVFLQRFSTELPSEFKEPPCSSSYGTHE